MGKERRRKPAPPPGNPNPLLSEVERFLEQQAAPPVPEPPPAVPTAPVAPTAPAPPVPSVEPAPAAAPEGRLAPAQHADLELFIRQEGLIAVVPALYPGTTMEEVLALLRRHEITAPAAEAAIAKALETVRQTGAPVREVIVARGRPPQPPQPPRLEYCPPEGVEAMPDLEPIRQALATPDRRALARAAAGLVAWTVRPGQRLAVQVVSEGKPGVGVQGQPIAPPARYRSEQPSPQKRHGPGVVLASGTGELQAEVWGCAGLLESRVAVVPPIWVAPDGAEACLLVLPGLPGSSPPTAGDLNAALTAAGVTYGVDQAAIDPLCQQLATADDEVHVFALARARPPVPPRDASLSFAFEHEFRAGTVRADGSIDFKERNFFPPVAKDALLVESQPQVPGKAGQDVRGDEIPPAAPVGVSLVAGDNARREERDQVQRLYAQIDGGASVQIVEPQTTEDRVRQCTVAVRPVAQVSGDVGYETGNLDLRGNLTVNGSVRAGFRVRATGDVAVSGSVEPGAQVQCGGSLTVQQGITGRETQVQAEGGVTAKFVQEARIQAGGDVVVGIYVHGAQVQSRGRVRVEGGAAGGGIVGGRTWAVKGIECRNLGSEHSSTTQVYAGLDPAHLAQAERLRHAVFQAETILRKFLHSIGLSALEPEAVRRLVAAKPANRTAVLYYVRKATQLAQVREQHRRELETLSAQLDRDAREATIDVADTVYPRVSLQIGNQQLLQQAELKRVRFCVDPAGEQPGILWKDLAPA